MNVYSLTPEASLGELEDEYNKLMDRAKSAINVLTVAEQCELHQPSTESTVVHLLAVQEDLTKAAEVHERMTEKLKATA